ncbi:pyridoxal-phosphate dependent enzyme [Pedobacter sp. MC2016-14]|uniref:1-aminocyclopropane-1-carboxylate deaminase/D-cysteine desulfhydrase n=1 Tax=Pedobacter sp. MC2016-14 TaxID=2897327 RepID=UPI001E42EFB5|nr:pyridoxal-phosphate dependent enzyme [Pedobacter sp. MC2016-14]MCD0489080.1 pyridoxal-phosphate dependent enzyme [Pedobacter sp. MC2016-14]
MFTNIFSPFQHLNHPILTQLWVKRDDLIDPFISGNKWRKLKYLIQDATSIGKTHLVTFGGAYSNHLVATAAGCARSAASNTGNKFSSTAFVRGEEVNNEMLTLCRLFGMNLIFTDRQHYKNKQQLFDEYFGANPEAYFIDEGGASAEAVKGCAEIIAELPPDIDHLFCAAGTGTTAAGLLKGIQDAGLKTQLHVIPVLKGGDFIAAEMFKYLGNLDQLVLHTGYDFGGYAKTQPELITFIKNFSANTGILLDPVYTGKLFYAINDLASTSELDKNAKVVALHTGGLLGIMGMKDKFF